MVTAVLGTGLAASTALASQACGAVTPTSADQASLQVQPSRLLRSAQAPLHLGFNLEWVPFQRDFWDIKESKPDPALARLMSVFPGAVYRYPGGTVSNFLDLAASLGPSDQRQAQQPVTWTGPVPMHFGLAEYFEFVRAVRGTSWLILNVYGRRDKRWDIAQLKPAWAQITSFAKTQQVPLRFELGNELYLPMYGLEADEYASRAIEAAQFMRNQVPEVPVVALLADFDRPGRSKRDFNRPVLRRSAGLVSNFAQHSYYDGPPGGPPVPNRLREICRTISDAKGSGITNPTIWVTEHARWPGGRTSDPDWKNLWPKTHDLGAALGVADYVIGLSQMAPVRGAFLHSLAGTQGPWPLMTRSSSGELIPSAVYRSLEVLLPMFGALDVHEAATLATDSGYAGGYDLRATVSRDPISGTWHVFAVQRSSRPLPVSVRIPGLANQLIRSEHRYITGTTTADNNTASSPQRIGVQTDSTNLQVDASGMLSITLPPLSVNHLTLPDLAAGAQKP